MTLNKGFNDELKVLTAEPVQGIAAGVLLPAALVTQGQNLDSPLRAFASSPADAFLNFSTSVTTMGDGGFKAVPPISNLAVPVVVASKINMGTGAVTGGTFTVTGVAFATAFALLTKTDQQFRRFAFAVQQAGTIAVAVSAESSTQAALQDYGVMFAGLGGLPVAYIDVQWIAASTQYRTATSTTSVIENKGIYRLPLGSGGGSGTGNANSFIDAFRDQLLDSPYQFVTPNVSATSSGSLYGTLTGAAYDAASTTVKFTANAQQIVSVTMLDSSFLSQLVDVGAVDLSVYWNLGNSIYTFSVPTGFTYEVSRDGGVNWFTVSMSQLGTSGGFYGTLRFDGTSTTEATPTALLTQSTQTATQALNTTTATQADQAFTLTSTSKIQSVKLSLSYQTTAPTGSLYVSIVSDNAGVASLLASGVLAQSNAINLANLGLTTTQTLFTIAVPGVVLAAGTYHIVVSTDSAYKTQFTTATTLLLGAKSAGSAPFMQLLSSGAYSASTLNMTYVVQGRVLDLRFRITSAGSPTYPCGLDAVGIFYNEQAAGLTGAPKKTNRFTFNSTTDNTNAFTLTFAPDPDLLTCFWIEGGQCFKSPAFSTAGNVVTFPANTFNQGGVSQTITLVFDQNNGGALDSSDVNARLMAASHLGSTGTEDKSLSGRGVVLRDSSGTLREIYLDTSDNLAILAAPGGALLRTIGNIVQPGVLAGLVSPNGLPGNAGTVVAATYVGQVISATLAGQSNASPTNNTWYDDSVTLSLPLGTWLIVSANAVSLSGPSGISGTIIPQAFLSIRTGSTLVAQAAGSSGQVNGVAATGNIYCSAVVNITATTTYKQSVGVSPFSGSPSVTNIGSLPTSASAFSGGGIFYATRIA